MKAETLKETDPNITRERISAELQPMLSGHPESLRRLALAGAERLSQMLHPADLLIYDTHAVAMGWTFTGKASDLVIHMPVYAKHINLGFNFGTSLEDPEGRLKGKGENSKHLHFASLSVLDDPYVVRLIEASMAMAQRGGSDSRVVAKTGYSKKPIATH